MAAFMAGMPKMEAGPVSKLTTASLKVDFFVGAVVEDVDDVDEVVDRARVVDGVAP
ncbi:hypothetical protein TUZN_1199 [Thermoproteus uzoniensis 768-20]|uniref:Uncharacterized protein n=1 Tax=Thermoproteus uzoniensis (strain 768-20) TaxID=999630 RepID=F2L0J6_THEU7|nr:hypothetical protein TUZN_1199 [Thermoproteus uzoniensis 768-20]